MKIAKALVLAVALVIGVQGCYGPFQLTRMLYNWNGSLGDKWAQEGVFLIIGCLLPVYGAAAFIDVIVLNSVHFWTGKNALKTEVVEKDGMKAVMRYDREKGTTFVEVFRDGTLEQSFVVSRGADGKMQAVTVDGAKLTARTEGSTVTVVDAKENTVGRWATKDADRYLN
jgi:hypothetical protein